MNTTTCIITCFNYGRYINHALDSVLGQTNQFDEIIVVNDASTDESELVIKKYEHEYPCIKLVTHARRAGQLAAFETGVKHARSELLFFLDADDVYASTYLERALAVYSRNPHCGFLFCMYEEYFNDLSGVDCPVSTYIDEPIRIRGLGASIVRTLIDEVYIGAPTSCLSMRKWVVDHLFPLPLHSEWITRADDCLVFGSSLVGAKKFKLEERLIGYRIHGSNAYAMNSETGNPDVFYMRNVRIQRLFEFLSRRLLIGSSVCKLAYQEFKTIPNPGLSEVFRYTRYVIRYGSHKISRVRALLVIVKWYWAARENNDRWVGDIVNRGNLKAHVIRNKIWDVYEWYANHMPINRGKYRMATMLRGLIGNPIREVGGVRLRLFPCSSSDIWLIRSIGSGTPIHLAMDMFLGPDKLFVDVGANIGLFSILAKTKYDSDVLAFEPSEREIRALRRNATLNGTDIDVRNYALGKTNGVVKLRVENSENHMKNRIIDGVSEGTGVVECAVRRFDDVVPVEEACKIGLVKIDVEGREMEVLEGMSRLLKVMGRAAFVIEVTPEWLKENGSSEEELYGFMAKHGRIPCGRARKGYQWDEIFSPKEVAHK